MGFTPDTTFPDSRRFSSKISAGSYVEVFQQIGERGACPQVSSPEQGQGIDRGSFPPLLVGFQSEDRKVKVRGLGGSVTCTPDVSENVPLAQQRPLRQALR